MGVIFSASPVNRAILPVLWRTPELRLDATPATAWGLARGGEGITRIGRERSDQNPETPPARA